MQWAADPGRGYMGMAGPYLQRFVDAQDEGETYARARSELAAGRKRTHWMWFVFPQQLAGLGSSDTARDYALLRSGEAAAYVAHPVLGARLVEVTRRALEGPAATAVDPPERWTPASSAPP